MSELDTMLQEVRDRYEKAREEQSGEASELGQTLKYLIELAYTKNEPREYITRYLGRLLRFDINVHIGRIYERLDALEKKCGD